MHPALNRNRKQAFGATVGPREHPMERLSAPERTREGFAP